MTYDEFVKFHEDMCIKMHDIVKVRNQGYSPYINPFSNFMKDEDLLKPYFGVRHPLISMHARAGDKHSRTETAILTGLPQHKDKYDEYIDGPNYFIFQAAWWETLYRNDPKLIEGPINLK